MTPKSPVMAVMTAAKSAGFMPQIKVGFFGSGVGADLPRTRFFRMDFSQVICEGSVRGRLSVSPLPAPSFSHLSYSIARRVGGPTLACQPQQRKTIGVTTIRRQVQISNSL